MLSKSASDRRFVFRISSPAFVFYYLTSCDVGLAASSPSPSLHTAYQLDLFNWDKTGVGERYLWRMISVCLATGHPVA